MKYNELTLGQIEAITNKLGGMGGINNFLSGKTIIRPSEKIFKVWKTIKIGTHKTSDDLLSELKRNDIYVHGCIKDAIEKSIIVISPSEEEVQLVKVSPRELGLSSVTYLVTYDEILLKAREFGLELCPPEVGPQLLLQYKGNTSGREDFEIAMKPLKFKLRNSWEYYHLRLGFHYFDDRNIPVKESPLSLYLAGYVADKYCPPSKFGGIQSSKYGLSEQFIFCLRK